MELKTYFAQDRAGNVIPNATATIYITGTNTLATGLKTVTNAALANPFTADANGQILFKAPDGIYDVQFSYGSQTGARITFQCIDAVTQIETAQAAATAATQAKNDTQAIIDAAGEQSTLAALAQPMGLKNIGRVRDIATLRTQIPTAAGQKVDVVSYYSTGDLWRGGGYFESVNDSVTVDDGGYFIRANASWGWKRPLNDMVSVFEFGVKADGVSDDTAAHQAAQDFAHRVSATVKLHLGVSRISNTIIQKANSYGFSARTTQFKALNGTAWATLATGIERDTGDLSTSSFKPMWQMGKKPENSFTPKQYLELHDAYFLGLGARPATRSADRATMNFFADGVHIANICQTPSLHNVHVELVQNGFNTYNSTGHVTWHNCTSSSCFYSWWCDCGTGDYRFFNCDLVSAQFASIGLHGSLAEVRTGVIASGAYTTGAGGVSMYSCHLGFSPYCIYQKDAADLGGGMLGWNCVGTHQEACGNKAVRLGDGPGGTSNDIIWFGGHTWTQPLGTGNTGYQIQGDANHPIQDVAWSIPHTLTSASSRVDLTGLGLLAGTTGYKIYAKTLQTSLIINDAFTYAKVDNNIQRLIDPRIRPYMAITSIANGLAINTNPQTISSLTVPASVKNAPRMLMEVSIPFRATAAVGGVQFSVRNQDGTSLGLAVHDVPTGNSTISVIIDFLPNGASTLNLVIATASTALSIGAGATSRVKWSAGFTYAS